MPGTIELVIEQWTSQTWQQCYVLSQALLLRGKSLWSLGHTSIIQQQLPVEPGALGQPLALPWLFGQAGTWPLRRHLTSQRWASWTWERGMWFWFAGHWTGCLAVGDKDLGSNLAKCWTDIDSTSLRVLWTKPCTQFNDNQQKVNKAKASFGQHPARLRSFSAT